jgi:hypothetical protein
VRSAGSTAPDLRDVCRWLQLGGIQAEASLAIIDQPEDTESHTPPSRREAPGSWAAGGTLGVDQLAVSLQERADERETGFVALVHRNRQASGCDRATLARVRSSLRDVRKVLLVLCCARGALLDLYGLTDIVADSIRAVRGTMENAIWYAVLWGPTWLLGGVLFLMTAWTFDAERRRAG